MKFQNYLEKITGVGMYPVISLILFVTFFAIVTYRIFSVNKEELDRQANIPLEK